jgi:hypothetical protein
MSHRRHRSGPLSARLCLTLALVVTACDQPPVVWRGDPTPLGGVLTDASVLAMRGAPDAVRVTPERTAIPGGGLPTLPARSCLSSIRWARARTGQAVAAVWWSARPDSSVVLYLARSSDDGVHWDTTLTADARDHGVRGCARPPPAVAADPVRGYTHLAYFLEPASGGGMFYEHLMDLPAATATGAAASGVSMFHAPVAIVFGEVPGHASVAGHGDTVVVAYQDPNRAAPQVALAVSVTAGHTFAPRLPVSGDNVEARDPTIGLDGAVVAVAWWESAVRSDGASDTSAAARAVVRVGTLR